MLIDISKFKKDTKKSLEILKTKWSKNEYESISSQDTIPIEQIFKDGIVRCDDNLYSKTMKFDDINYRLANTEDKKHIFRLYSEFLNYFDENTSVQFTFLNVKGENEREYEDIIDIKSQDDDFNKIREEFKELLRTQMAKGNNGIKKLKYITFGIREKDHHSAKARLEAIERDIITNIRKIGVKAESLDNKGKMKLLHNCIYMQNDKNIQFDWSYVSKTGQTPKDYLAPSSFDFTDVNSFKIEDKEYSVSALQIPTPELSEKMLSDFLEMDCSQNITIHIQSLDHVKALKMIKNKLSDLQRTMIDGQKKAVREGYDIDIMSNDLHSFVADLTQLLTDLQSRNERLFIITILFVHTEKNKKSIENIIKQASNMAQQRNCNLIRLNYVQEDGFKSILPIAKNEIEIKRGITTSGVSSFMPFTTSELLQGGESLYYGLNAVSNNLIMADRKQLPSPNGIILGTSGSGKSFTAKREIYNVFIKTTDDILVLDPENEYSALVSTLKGQVVKVSSNTKNYINPLDIVIDPDNPKSIGSKPDFILSFFEIILGELSGRQRGIIDKCLDMIYKPYLSNPVADKMPILEDLYNALLEYNDGEDLDAIYVADSMAIYVNGSLNIFNHKTNIEINNRIVCFNVKELENSLKELGMLVIQELVWNRVSLNRDNKKSTRYYVDEMHLLLHKEETARYSVEMWKRFRKWGGIPTGITQNVKDFLASPEVENIFENSHFVLLLNQFGHDREILAKRLNISAFQLEYVTNSSVGEGLIYYNGTIIPFIDKFPKDTFLYKIMTTKLDESVSVENGDV